MISVCIQIYFARILDVSLNTIRTFYCLKGKTIFSTIISFFEVLIWFMVARKALNVNVFSIWIPISYALGYSTGNLIGSFITNNIIKTNICVNVITNKRGLAKILSLNKYNYAYTYLNENKILYLINTYKKDIKNLYEKIILSDKKALVYTNDVKLIINKKTRK